MAEISSDSQFFSGNIANMIPESLLNKMVPLTEDHGGARGPPLAHGLIVIQVIPGTQENHMIWVITYVYSSMARFYKHFKCVTDILLINVSQGPDIISSVTRWARPAHPCNQMTHTLSTRTTKKHYFPKVVYMMNWNKSKWSIKGWAKLSSKWIHVDPPIIHKITLPA